MSAVIAPPPVCCGETLDVLQQRILRYVRTLVSDPDVAEDLTQETFLHATRKFGDLKAQDPAAQLGWLYRIATHICVDRSRRPE